MFLWVLRENKLILFRRIDINECFVRNKGAAREVDEVFGEETAFRKFHVLRQGHYEDRSLFLSKASHPTRLSHPSKIAWQPLAL